MLPRILLVLFLVCAARLAFAVEFSPGFISHTSTNSDSDLTLVSSVSGVTGPFQLSFFYRKVPLADKSPFTIVVLPDTQNYSAARLGGSPEMFFSQIEWILSNRKALNIAAVLHVGDIVDNSNVREEFHVATNAMYRLSDPVRTDLPDGIPYIIGPGNHDGFPLSGYAEFNRYFGVDHFKNRSYYGGHLGTNNNNSFILFSAGGMDFIALALEYAPPRAALEWANQVLATNAHRRAVVVSHSIINPTTVDAVYNEQGQAIYTALRTNANIFMMFCGHVPTTARKHDTFQGNAVDVFLNDYEAQQNGGNGWLRTVEFLPASNMLDVRTFSPWSKTYFIGPWHEWQIPYDMSLEGERYLLGGSLSTNGSPVIARSEPLLNLSTNTWYEWYIQVDTGEAKFTSPKWLFYNNALVQKREFDVISISSDSIGRPSLSWNSIGGSRYRIEVSDGGTGNWRDLVRPDNEEVDSAPPGVCSVQIFTDDYKYTAGPPGNGGRFFRIRKIDQNP